MRPKTDEEYKTTKENLVKHLSEGVCHFSFRTSKGEVREAYGTTKSELLPMPYKKEEVDMLFERARDIAVSISTETLIKGEVDSLMEALKPFTPKPKGSTNPKPDNIVNFFDINKQAWRSCNADKLIIIY